MLTFEAAVLNAGTTVGRMCCILCFRVGQVPVTANAGPIKRPLTSQVITRSTGHCVVTEGTTLDCLFLPITVETRINLCGTGK